MKKHLFFCLLVISICNVCCQEKKISLLFAGDAMQHKVQLDGAKTTAGYDYSSYFKQIKKEIDSADIAIVNLETTLPGKRYSGYPNFGSPDEFAYALKDAGFDIFLTANNHCLDKGVLGLERTISILDSINIKHLGTYVNQDRKDILYPMIIVKNGIRIGMLNYTYGTNGIPVTSPNIVNFIDKVRIMEDLEEIQLMNPDIIIANMHWGDEYVLKPNKEQKDLADFLINNGVRLVIGSHPHVVQPIDIKRSSERIDNVVIYSLGNFISGMKKLNTDGGMMVRINLVKNDEGVVDIEDCSYSLVWVHKPIENGRIAFQLIPAEQYDSEEGNEKLGEIAFKKMRAFIRNAKETIESMWIKPAENQPDLVTRAQ